MTLSSGNHSIGPDVGKLTIHTFRAGVGAKVGHDLILEATRWSGSLDIDADNPAASNVSVTVDTRSLAVVDGHGGVKPLSDKDRGDIVKNINDKSLQTAKYPEITFQSTSVMGSAPRLTVSGDLTIVGQTRPATLDVSVDDSGSGAKVTARTTVVQSEFGIKPYSAMLGALKVRDAVDLEVDLNLT